MSGDFLTKREGIWHYVRRVPLGFSDLDKRTFVRQSTRIRVADDPRGAKARKAADRINAEVEAYWRGLVDGQSAEAKRRYEAARRRARTFGFDYTLASDVAERPFSEVLARIETLVLHKAVDEEGAVAAVLGGESPPAIMLSGLFGEFEAMVQASIKDLSPDQVRKWRNPKRRAIANLIEVIGDKPITGVSRNDALDFRTWWQDRVLAEGVEIGTANKDIGHLNKMFRTLDRSMRLGLGPVFGDLRIEGESTNSRVPFDVEFVQREILKDGALAGLNEEARRVLYLIAETGLRLSEAANLNETTIKLDAEVPHVMVRPDGRRMKTEQSAREIPLVGAALKAMQAHPHGFPRYRDRSASLSATLNKFLSENGLRPTFDHSAYSLRHTFEDRLTAVEAPEKLIANLMGHKYSRPKYGSGPSLKQKLEWLQRIALTSPEIV